MQRRTDNLVGIVVANLVWGSGAAIAQTPVSLWVHAGPGPERDVYLESVKAFNSSQNDIRVELESLPEGSYTEQVNQAAVEKRLPCILDFDGPNVYNYAWSGKIIPLDGFLEFLPIKGDLLPTLRRQGNYNNKLFSLGQYDSGLALWGNRKLLTQAGVRIPQKISEAWTLGEFEDALQRLKAMGLAFPLDMKFEYGVGEWFTYGFSPIVQSFGGDLINRVDFRSASGVINSPGAVRALTALQAWVKKGYVSTSPKGANDFENGKAALSYVGHWTYREYKNALGDELVLIPMPKFGDKAVTGAGSWNFGISADCKEPKAAAQVLAFLMSPAEIGRVTRVNGAIPGTFKALNANKNFATGGALEVYAQQIAWNVSQVRPETPAYPVVTTAFSGAVKNIIAGADVQAELDKAARAIDKDIEEHRGYSKM